MRGGIVSRLASQCTRVAGGLDVPGPRDLWNSLELKKKTFTWDPHPCHISPEHLPGTDFQAVAAGLAERRVWWMAAK